MDPACEPHSQAGCLYLLVVPNVSRSHFGTERLQIGEVGGNQTVIRHSVSDADNALGSVHEEQAGVVLHVELSLAPSVGQGKTRGLQDSADEGEFHKGSIQGNSLWWMRGA